MTGYGNELDPADPTDPTMSSSSPVIELRLADELVQALHRTGLHLIECASELDEGHGADPSIRAARDEVDGAVHRLHAAVLHQLLGDEVVTRDDPLGAARIALVAIERLLGELWVGASDEGPASERERLAEGAGLVRLAAAAVDPTRME